MCERRWAVILSLTILVLLAASGSVVEAASGPTVRVEPASLQVSPDETFVVRVVIEDVENLGGFQLALAYDPSLMAVEEAAVGDFLGSTGRNEIPVGPKIDNDGGSVVLGAATFGEAAGPNGSGPLATVTGRARGAGSAALRLEDVQVLNPAAGAIAVETVDGQLVVEEAGAAAEPTETPSGAPVSPSPEVPTATSTAPSEAPSAPTTVPMTWVAIGVLVAALGGAALLVGLRRQRDGEAER